MANQGLSDLIGRLYGTESSTKDYLGSINKGYELLNQPGSDPGTGREEKTQQFVAGLAATFADKVFKKTGQLPSEDQVRQFVANTASGGNASKFILGNLGGDVMNSLAEEYIQGNPEIGQLAKPQAQVTANDIGQGTNRALDQTNAIYDMVQNQAVEANRRAFAPLRTRAAEEEAALGRLRSPVSAAPGSNISNIDQQEGNSLSGIIGNILGQKASGTMDLTKFNEQLGAGERRAGEAESQFARNLAANRSQFNQNLNFQRDRDDYERMLNNRQLSLSEMLGRRQADGPKRDWLDYLNAGVGAAGTAANIYTGFGGGMKPKA